MSIGLLGQKIGMTSVYDAKGRLCSVTVIAVGDNVLLRRLTAENEGYSAVQIGFGEQKESRLTKPLIGEFKKAGVGPQRLVREFRLKRDLPEGEIDLTVTQFQPGDFVDVIGRSKGKGFQGVMKKHNFAGQGAAHGSKTHRRIGAVGNRSTPGRIWKNQGMPGHMGDRGTQAVHDVVVAMRAARRSGSANTKTKAEVDLSGAKPWRQKGTGRARAGYKSSPIWRGGGVVFGPKPRDYSKKVAKSVRRLAFRKALSERINGGDVLTIDNFVVPQLKTKSFVDLVREQTDAAKVLIVSDSFDEKTYKSARNVKPVSLATASDVNTEQLLGFQKILITQKGLEKLAERTRPPSPRVTPR